MSVNPKIAWMCFLLVAAVVSETSAQGHPPARPPVYSASQQSGYVKPSSAQIFTIQTGISTTSVHLSVKYDIKNKERTLSIDSVSLIELSKLSASNGFQPYGDQIATDPYIRLVPQKEAGVVVSHALDLPAGTYQLRCACSAALLLRDDGTTVLRGPWLSKPLKFRIFTVVGGTGGGGGSGQGN